MISSDDEMLRPAASGYLSVLRVRWLRSMAMLLAAAMAVDWLVIREFDGPVGVLSLVVALVGIWSVWRAPVRQFALLGHSMDNQCLRVVRGYLFHVDTVVPLVRIQHIDVGQGPLERMCGVAHLVVHTAGTHNSIVVLPGLLPETAREMRDAIRLQIRTDLA
jgi:membrane protein YdbS with pleckstrin-like domain